MAYLLLVFTVLFWAGNFVVARAMHLELPPVTMAFMRWSLAFILISPWLIPRFWRLRAVIRRHWKILVFYGVVGVAGFNTQIYLGLQDTQATNATLMQSFIPILILVISALGLRQPVSRRQWLGVLISFAGICFLVSKGQWQNLAALTFNPGDIWILGAVVVWALYSVALRWRPAELDGLTLLGVTVLVAVLTLAPLSYYELRQGAEIHWSQGSIATILYMALFPSILSYIFWNKGVEQLGAPVAGLFIHLLPVFGLILSALLLGEQIYAFHLYGVALIFTGIYLALIADALKILRRHR
ncbi:DMT family transporter [Marinobacterium jannaschii]|uniref:DMT family transporter n=1 Tax=Marinobacterium jannaschii TaxID=64970 RepID=UPI000488A8B5|nr:DMT family transporter [Marinobacterium jannaschii]